MCEVVELDPPIWEYCGEFILSDAQLCSARRREEVLPVTGDVPLARQCTDLTVSTPTRLTPLPTFTARVHRRPRAGRTAPAQFCVVRLSTFAFAGTSSRAAASRSASASALLRASWNASKTSAYAAISVSQKNGLDQTLGVIVVSGVCGL